MSIVSTNLDTIDLNWRLAGSRIKSIGIYFDIFKSFRTQFYNSSLDMIIIEYTPRPRVYVSILSLVFFNRPYIYGYHHYSELMVWVGKCLPIWKLLQTIKSKFWGVHKLKKWDFMSAVQQFSTQYIAINSFQISNKIYRYRHAHEL